MLCVRNERLRERVASAAFRTWCGVHVAAAKLLEDAWGRTLMNWTSQMEASVRRANTRISRVSGRCGAPACIARACAVQGGEAGAWPRRWSGSDERLRAAVRTDSERFVGERLDLDAAPHRLQQAP
jgi:hypothetical protein